MQENEGSCIPVTQNKLYCYGINISALPLFVKRFIGNLRVSKYLECKVSFYSSGSLLFYLFVIIKKLKSGWFCGEIICKAWHGIYIIIFLNFYFEVSYMIRITRSCRMMAVIWIIYYWRPSTVPPKYIRWLNSNSLSPS